LNRVFVAGAFDDLCSIHIRFLEEASQLGPVTVALWPDSEVSQLQEKCKFPFEERRYVLQAIRFVDQVVGRPDGARPDELSGLPGLVSGGGGWAVPAIEATEDKADFCRRHGMELVVIPSEKLGGFHKPTFDPSYLDDSRKRIVVTGCYDWFHSGHVRFFEECSQLGDLYVVVGHDANVRLLKGEGHPLIPEEERRYVVGSCRHVTQALLTSGMGWMDAEPEIALIRPHIYAVNEDGDKPEKRAFCAEHGLEYVVLKRSPKEGLPRRSSTELRGY
jgi:cytidyltransferase-like protein